MNNILSTKQIILDYLVEKTELYGTDYLQFFTTKRISYQLNISRSLTSQYLNELCKEKLLIKVNSRPVYYFSKKSLEKKYGLKINELEFYNMNDLLNSLSVNLQKNDIFSKLIGYDGSLYNCISQMKTAIAYPPRGLPLILRGEMNLEYHELIHLLFQHGKKNQIFSSESKLKMIDAGSDSLEKLEKLLCDEESISLEKLKGGILYISNAQLLSQKIQRKLADYISENMQDISSKKARIILQIDIHSSIQLDEKLSMNIPFICDVPTWRSRNANEKEKILLYYLKREEVRLQKKIRITRNLFTALMEYSFLGNLREIDNTIKSVCVNAWMEQQDKEVLDINMQNLPANIPLKGEGVLQWKKDNENKFFIDDKENTKEEDKILHFFDKLLDSHILYKENHILFTDFCKQGMELLRDYYDFIIFDYHYDEDRLKKLEEGIDRVLRAIGTIHKIRLPLNCSFVLAHIVNRFSNRFNLMINWEKQRKNDIKDCLKSFMDYLPEESMMAMEMNRALLSSLDIQLSDGNIIFLILNIYFYNKDISHKDTCGLIISHGYSTASSIADACNHLLQSRIFEAIDMPLDTQVDEIIPHIESFTRLYPFYENLILLVDMGSLVEIGNKLKVDMNIGVINNISTGLALEVGNLIMQQKEMEIILKQACDTAKSYYQIIPQIKKRKAILFTNDAGIMVSKRMIQLFQDSLMKQIDLQFIEYDYDFLMTNKENDKIFQKYDIALVVKPHSLELNNIPSLSLEDIVGFRDIEKLHLVLHEYLTEEEIEIFDQHLLKNFSLQSLMGNLTILNPARLMDEVSDAVENLQKLMKYRFHSKTLAGIYIHISFLIERLITRKAIGVDGDFSLFEKEHKEFIQNVNKSFSYMLQHYNVELPISEISYLYDYILHDKNYGGNA